MAKQVTKKQHWVPQFYLKNFANTDGKLHALDLRKGKILTKTYYPSEICYEDFFYGTKTGVEDEISQELEEIFQMTEDELSDEYDRLCKELLDKNKAPEEEDLYLLAQHLSFLWIRSAYFRETMHRSMGRLLKDISIKRALNKEHFYDVLEKSSSKKHTPEEKEKIRQLAISGEYDLAFSNDDHLRFLLNAKGFGNLLFHKKWRIYYIRDRDDFSFLTSDTPIIEVYPPSRGYWGYNFMERTHYFAMTPKVLIEFIDIDSPGKRVKRKEIKSKEQVEEFNLKRLQWSYEFAYSGDRVNFRKAETYKEMQEFALQEFIRKVTGN